MRTLFTGVTTSLALACSGGGSGGSVTPGAQDPYPAYTPTVYGSAVNAAEITNYVISDQKVSFNFRAKHTGLLSGVRIYTMGGVTGYSAGTGGIWRISLRDDTLPDHFPASTFLASLTHSFTTFTNRPISEIFPLLTFDAPATVTAGTLYHVVFENIDADPLNNFASINTLTMWPREHLTPEQPFAADSDWNSLYSAPPYTTWQQINWGRTPMMEYYFTDGYSTGMGYMEVWISNLKTISGDSAVRETFTVAGRNRNVSTAAVWVKRLSGSDSLTLTLEQTDGVLLAQVLAPAASISSDEYSWVHYAFPSTQDLIVGQSYNLVLSAPAGTTYETYAICDGGSIFTANARFADGYAQFNTGSGWTGWDMWGATNRTDGDLMFYLSQ